MTYRRVLPRDLFNEASLLKCLGALWIKLDGLPGNRRAAFDQEDVESFDIDQSQDTGAIFVANLRLIVKGEAYLLTRPLNSRDPWPLYVESEDNYDFETIAVFEDNGELSADFLAFVKG